MGFLRASTSRALMGPPFRLSLASLTPVASHLREIYSTHLEAVHSRRWSSRPWAVHQLAM